MRNVNPDDLDQLAKLFDGKGGIQDKLNEAFSRASNLGVDSTVTSLKPLRSWVTDTAPDLRKRAAIARLDKDDSEASAKWAGFDAKDLLKAGLIYKAPDVLLLANALASSDNSDADAFRRKSRESLDEWVDRLRAHAFASTPALKPYEKDIEKYLGTYGNVTGFIAHSGSASFHGGNLARILVGNSIAQGGWANGAKMWTARKMIDISRRYSWAPSRVAMWGRDLRRWEPPIRSLAAPGSWLPSKLGALASGSSAYQDINRFPLASTYIGGRIGMGLDWVRRSGVMDSPLLFSITGNKAINFLMGSGQRLGPRQPGEPLRKQRVRRQVRRRCRRSRLQRIPDRRDSSPQPLHDRGSRRYRSGLGRRQSRRTLGRHPGRRSEGQGLGGQQDFGDRVEHFFQSEGSRNKGKPDELVLTYEFQTLGNSLTRGKKAPAWATSNLKWSR
ncbi:hypothetical protein OG520_16810 [Streptomyces sp. NBC_00984]|uniref:hypothetical protein n=1 Tax=Streptomyces sp. NBC_00984 TaxID=2903700 RepID=UPI0038686BC8|nr:hypothetical protein OG520_16810 [Streptomyces sp. NBC_00984]